MDRVHQSFAGLTQRDTENRSHLQPIQNCQLTSGLWEEAGVLRESPRRENMQRLPPAGLLIRDLLAVRCLHHIFVLLKRNVRLPLCIKATIKKHQ